MTFGHIRASTTPPRMPIPEGMRTRTRRENPCRGHRTRRPSIQPSGDDRFALGARLQSPLRHHKYIAESDPIPGRAHHPVTLLNREKKTLRAGAIPPVRNRRTCSAHRKRFRGRPLPMARSRPPRAPPRRGQGKCRSLRRTPPGPGRRSRPASETGGGCRDRSRATR